MRKRITSLLLVLALCLTLLPSATLAEAVSPEAQETQDSIETGDVYTIEEDTAVQGKGENDKAVQTVQALIDALPAAEDISDANADEVSGQLDAIDEAKQALTEEQAARLDLTGYDAAAAAVLALAGEPDANEPAVLADTIGTQPSGSGTAEAPYQITSAADLIWLRDAVNTGAANTCAELQQDVTHVDEIWTSIGTSEHPYTGIFNGNGHTIRVWLDGWGQALFGYVGAGAKLTDLAVTKRQSENYSLNASAPLARINDGTITHCWYRGAITAKGTLGGLVYTNNGTIEACYVYAGQLDGGSRIEMYNGGWAGGIAYENTGTIVNSYFYGDIVQAQSNGTVRDIIGWGAIAYKNSGRVSNCYYGADRDDGYGGKTEDQFRGGEVAYLLNGGTARDDWRQNRYAGDDTPVLDRSHAQVRKSGDYYVSLYPHVHCICGGGTTSGGHPQHSDVTYTAWTDDEAASQYGASSYTAANSLPKKPGKYYLTSDVTLRDTGTWRPADGTVLCLNGQTVREFAFDTPAYDAITVGSGVTFSLTECASIQGDIHCASSAATHTVNNSGTFNLYNGRLRGTTSTADGAAVYNNGTFNMYGGIISNNGTTARGGGVYNAGTCNLYGGTITNNGAGGGVYNNGTLTVGGTATVTGGSPNVYLAAGKTITLNSALDESARIGITAENQSSLTDTAAAITVVEDGAASLVCFFPDDDGTYDLSFNDDDDVLLHLIRDHTHCACGHKGKYARSIGDHTEHVDREFVAWTDELVKKQYGSNTTYKAADTLPKAAGYYYLTSDVDLGAYPWAPKDGTILCLNGHKITSSWSTTVRIDSDAHIVLTDCRASGSIRNTNTSGAALKSSGSSISRNGIADIFRISLSGTSVGVENYTSNTVNLYNSTVSGTRSAIYNTGTVNIAGTVKAASDAVDSGRYCVNNLGTLTVDGTLTADGGNIGVANRVEDSRSGTITVNGTLICTGDSDGLSNRGTATVAGTLTATGKRNDGVYNYGGTLTVNGTLTATGNASGKQTDGLDNSNNGTVTINGTLTASGGQFSVYNYGTLNLSGTVNATKNVFLGTGRTVTVVGELDDATSIPIQTAATPEAGSPVTIATTENANWIKEGSFVSWTPGKYAVSRIDEGKTVVLRGHEHDWSYTLGSDGTAISAECGNADGLCGNTNGGSVTIAPPSGELIYDGSAKAAKLTKTGWTAADVGEIVYQKDGSALSAVPVDAGTYTAGITVGGQTASVTYEIGKATPMAKDFVFAAPGNLNYDGNSKIVTVSSTKISMDDVTVKYYDKDGEEAEPKNAGDYIVKVSVAEGANYNATTDDLTTDDWKFTIGKATQTIIVPTDKTIVKDGIAEDISDWATVAGVTGGSNPGTLSYALEGSYTGVALEGNQLTVGSSVATGTTITIKVTAEETGNYNKEEQTFTVKVADKNTATVTITGLPDTVTYGQAFTLTASQTGDTTSANKKWTWDYDRECFKLVGPNANTETITLQAIKAGTPSKGITVTYESGTHKGSKTVTPGVAQKEVTVSGITAANKEYDGNTDATVNASGATITGIVSGDSLTITATGSFADADVGENKTVTLTLDTLGGADSANYTLATAGNQTETKANITAKDVSISAVTVSDKDYNGNANATVASVTITGVSGALSMGTDFDVTSATFPDADADTANVDVTINVALKGTAANNYNLTNGMGYVVTSAAKINKAAYSGSAPTKTVNILKNYAGVQTGTLTAADFFATAPAEAKITAAVPDSTSSSMMSIAGADSSGNFTYDSKTNITAASDESWTVTISSKNYTNITAMLTFSLVDRTNAGVTISGVPTSKIYGESFTLTASVTDAGTGTGSWTWTSNDPSVLQVTGTGASATVKALKAGSATISAKYESDTTMGEQTTASITVGKRVITVTADNKSMTVNGTLPTFTVTYGNLPSGVQAADIFGTLASASTTTDGKTTGSFDITVTTPVLKTEAGANYEVGAVTKGTLTVNPRSSSGGGGGGSVSTYSVTVGKTENGSVSVSPKSASKGDTVTITVTPDKGYVLETLTVLDKNDKEIKLTEKNGKYTFTMPAGKVEVKVTFMDDNTMLNYFVDVKADNYFYDAVKWAAEKGITSGTDATHFGPNAVCTRAQIVTFLWRTTGSPEPKSTGSFADVPTDSYYAKAVAWAVENGITGGTGDGKFSPDATCTRAQAVTFLYRASGMPAVSGNAAFSDVATNAYYAAAVKWAEKNGITGGIGGGLFGSDNNCTRAQIVTFLYRNYQNK